MGENVSKEEEAALRAEIGTKYGSGAEGQSDLGPKTRIFGRGEDGKRCFGDGFSEEQ